FNDELLKDIIPFVETNYRTVSRPDSRALSGLSMGGIQTLNIGLHNLGTFRYVAVMSSGWTTEEDREFFYKAEAEKIPKFIRAQAVLVGLGRDGYCAHQRSRGYRQVQVAGSQNRDS